MHGKHQLIIDGHLDMAFNALFYRRDLTQPVSVLREREEIIPEEGTRHPDSLHGRKGPEQLYYTPTVALPDMRRGRIGIMLSTIMARVQNPSVETHNSVRTQSVAYARGQSHLAYYAALERAGEIELIKNRADLDRCVEAWGSPHEETPVGLILTMESADPILGPDNVSEWWESGLRSVTLTHFGANTYGHGTGTEGGLFPPAYALMDALKETDIAIDLTHAADLCFWQILDYWDGPVHASHCNCRALVTGQRHLSTRTRKYDHVCGSAIGGSARRAGDGQPWRAILVGATRQYPKCRPISLGPGVFGAGQRWSRRARPPGLARLDRLPQHPKSPRHT